jgi:maltooligosyltrehalose synthase
MTLFKVQVPSDILALRERIRVGNDKLTKAWLQILDIKDKVVQNREDDRWYKARRKLEYLCLELQAKGYEDCLYLDENGRKERQCPTDPTKFWCWVCSSKKPYWRDEDKEVVDGKVQS